MPNKRINHGILKTRHTGDNNPVTFTYQKKQDKPFIKPGIKGRGIHIGSYMDFNASANYKEMKFISGTDSVVNQRKKDNVRTHIAPPKHHHETNPLHLANSGGNRPDADHIVGN